MFNRFVLAAFMLAIAISITAGAAKDEPRKEECPTLDHGEIEELLRQAPSCRRAAALFEICQFSSSGDVSLGAVVTEKCEADFLGKLTAEQRRAYDGEQKRCIRKYRFQAGTMYQSFEAFCRVNLARNYSTKALKAVRPGRK